MFYYSKCRFPKDFVKIIPSFSRPARAQQNNVTKKCAISQIKASLPPPSSIPVINQCNSPIQSNRDLLKENVIRELLETELNYVKLLGSLCLGYVTFCFICYIILWHCFLCYIGLLHYLISFNLIFVFAASSKKWKSIQVFFQLKVQT